MITSRAVTAAFVAIVLSTSPVAAQGLRGVGGPAEQPPASYSGSQYVDSRGCIFVRAGFDGNVTWVPRVNRARQPICGQAPTLARRSAPAPAAPVPAPEPRIAANPQPVAAPPPAPAAVAQPAPRATVRPAISAPRRPAGTALASRPSSAQPGTTLVGGAIGEARSPVARPVQPRIAAPAPQATPEQYRILRRGAAPGTPLCVGLDGVETVGCPRVFERPAAVAARRAAIETGPGPARRAPRVVKAEELDTVARDSRIVPSHLYQPGKLAGLSVPKGFKPAWNDDRLNPNRAVQTPRGRDQMLLVWTNTVPYRLIDKSTGRDVTALFPGLKREGVVSTKQTVKAAPKARRAVVSTKSAPRKPAAAAQPRKAAVKTAPRAPAAAAVKRYVQVGTFGVPANADAAVAKLRAAGLPAAKSGLTRGGKALKVIYAGPFRSDAEARAALSSVRRAGYGDAFIR